MFFQFVLNPGKAEKPLRDIDLEGKKEEKD